MAKRGRKKDYKERRKAFQSYVKNRGNLTATAKDTGKHTSQLSRWANEEDWDSKLSAMRERVKDKLLLDELEEEQSLVLGAKEEEKALLQARELAIMGLESVRDGEVAFETMGEVLRALKDYRDELRLFEGKPTQRSETRHSFKLDFGDDDNHKSRLEAMLSLVVGSERKENDYVDIEVDNSSTDTEEDEEEEILDESILEEFEN